MCETLHVITLFLLKIKQNKIVDAVHFQSLETEWQWWEFDLTRSLQLTFWIQHAIWVQGCVNMLSSCVLLRRKIFTRSSWGRCRRRIRRSCCGVRFWRFGGFWRFWAWRFWTWGATFFWSTTFTFFWFLWFAAFRLIGFSLLGFLGFFRLWFPSSTSFSGMFHCWSYMPEN